MKPYLLTMTSYISGVQDYLDSMVNLDQSVDPLVFSYNPQVPSGQHYTVYRTDHPYRGNFMRFADFPTDLDPERMVIFTDAADVIFQAPIPPLENKIYVCPEYDTFGKHSWFHSYFEQYNFHDLDDAQIFNMGTWAMPFRKAQELVAFLYKNRDLFEMWWGADQPLYNLWLKGQLFDIHPSLMGCLYNGYWSGEIEKQDGIFYTRQGLPLSIVHANGNSKPLLGEPHDRN